MRGASPGFLLLASVVYAQPAEQTIERLTIEWMTAVANKDDATLNRIMADEFIAHVPESGRSISRSEWLRQARLMENAECEYKSTQVRNYGEWAIASGHLVCKGEIKRIGLEDDSIVTDTWVRKDGQWRVSMRVAATTPRFTGIWRPLAIGAGIPSLLWLIVAIRARTRASGSLLSSANRPSC
jgi:ketosteroid isomerase-like protein